MNNDENSCLTAALCNLVAVLSVAALYIADLFI